MVRRVPHLTSYAPPTLAAKVAHWQQALGFTQENMAAILRVRITVDCS